MTSDQSKNQTVTNMMMKMTATSTWKFHHTEKVFPQGSPPLSERIPFLTLNEDDVNLISEIKAGLKEDRKRQHNEDLTNEVDKISDNRFNRAEGSPIFTKIPKKN